MYKKMMKSPALWRVRLWHLKRGPAFLPTRTTQSQLLEAIQRPKRREIPNPTLSPRASRAQELGVASQRHLSPKGASPKRPIDAISISDGSTTVIGQSHAYKVTSGKEQDLRPWMSACSDAGVAWVCEATRESNICRNCGVLYEYQEHGSTFIGQHGSCPQHEKS
jgi:hypothetical protein